MNRSTTRLTDGGIDDARLNAERLLAHVLGVKRIDLYLDFDRPLTAAEKTQFASFIHRRLEHVPLQYILGETEFMSLRFKVTPDVLIPRPETEVLVENTIAQVKKVFGTDKEISCLDIGTGCGNIAVSLAYYLKNTRVWAVDISEAALAVAKENAGLNGVAVRVHFFQADAMQADFAHKIGRRFDVLVSNPPYISESEYRTLPLEIQNFEPKLALDGGADGLRFYRALGQSTKILLKQKGVALFEIGAYQADQVVKIFKEKVRIINDIAGKDRVAFINNQQKNKQEKDVRSSQRKING